MAWLASNRSRWASSSLHSWWSLNRNQTPQPTPSRSQFLILDISRGVFCYKKVLHISFWRNTWSHGVLIDRVIIRTCFDAFSCAFQKRTEAKDHTLTSKTTQKNYAKQHDFFTTSRFWDFFLSWRRNQRCRLDDFGDPNPASSRASVERWSWAFFFPSGVLQIESTESSSHHFIFISSQDLNKTLDRNAKHTAKRCKNEST